MKEGLLSLYCKWNDPKTVKQLLKENPGMDLKYNSGICFFHAIKQGSTEMLGDLLQYYTDTNIKGDPRSHECVIARNELREILQDIHNTSTFEWSPEIIQLLDPFFHIGAHDSDTDQDLGSDDDSSDPTFAAVYHPELSSLSGCDADHMDGQ